ncbi:hypothetical protein [Streptomyces sp. WM6378]|nr:hypothetical protein [Streptomyces sp. WM6378]
MVIGGKLGTEGAAASMYGPGLLAAGFTAVFGDGCSIEDFRE